MSSPPKPAINLQELAKAITDSWTNSPLNHKKGQPKKEMYKDACWLSYVLHHAVVEAACNGLDIFAAPGKRVDLASVVDAMPKFKLTKAHSWNIFRTIDESGKVLFYCVDLAVDQFDLDQLVVPGEEVDGDAEININKNKAELRASTTSADSSVASSASTEVSSNCGQLQQQTANYVPVPGMSRVKKDGLFKTSAGSKEWVGRGVFVAGADMNPNELAARREQWPYYLQTFLAVATRAKKAPEIPKEFELDQDTLLAKKDAAELGQSCAHLGDRQGEDAIKPHLDSFKFMFQRIKPCRKMCLQKVPGGGSGCDEKQSEMQ